MRNRSQFRAHLLSLCLGATALAAACVHSSPAEEPPPSTPSADPKAGETEAAGAEAAETAEATETEAAPQVIFDELSHPEKMRHMKTVVSPQMARLFQAYDSDEFSDFGCTDCHGSSARQGNFAMPNAELPALDPSDHFASARAHDPKMLDFMMQEVVPKMAELMGEEPYDPDKGEGFGCFECHTMKN